MTVLDTNIVIYLLEGRLDEPIEDEQVAVSVITEIELLSFSKVDAKSEAGIRAFLGSILVVPLTIAIKDRAIQLRREHRLRIPDAIVAGTASVLGAALLTNDADLVGMAGVRCKSIKLK